MTQQNAPAGLLQHLKNIAEKIPFFLFTLPLFVVTHIETQYRHFIVYRFVYKEITWLFLAPVIAYAVSYLLYRQRRKAGIFAFILLVVYYFFCDLRDSLYLASRGGLVSKYSFLLPLLFAVIVAFFFIIKKAKASLKTLYLFVNIALLLFIASDGIAIALDSSVDKNDLGDRNKALSKGYTPCNSCPKPDIFYIVFDEYSSSEILQSEFGFHNDLDSFLREKKFRVVTHSRSNYNLTPFSIGSCFNLDYLYRLDTQKDFYMREYLPGLPTVYKSELVPILRREGYEIANLSIFNISNHKPETVPFDLWQLTSLYGRHNMFEKIDYDIGWFIRSRLSLGYGTGNYRQKRNDHLADTYKKLMQRIRESSAAPEFVYAHFMLPHAPYSFDTAGNVIPPPRIPPTKKEDKQAYINQLIYTNSIIRKITDSIFVSRKEPFILILQGDHGYKQHDKAKDHLEFGNLNALYFYNQDYRLINDSTTNVNTFRIVLNTFFDQKFEILKDTSYFLQYK